MYYFCKFEIMCGISGFIKFSKDLSSIDLENFGLNMSNTLKRRGPDAFGVWSSQHDGVCLSHRRLSILDLSKKANQPMISSDKRYVLVYNGEIYNFLDIKNELEKLIDFKTSSDTEVVLEAIKAWGIRLAIQKFNGMFAFALWDNKTKKLSIARDRVGIKPIFWYYDDNTFAFCSELKGFKSLPWINFKIDDEAVASYVRLNFVPAPSSIFKNIHKLSPGSFIEINRKKIYEQNFWSLKNFILKTKRNISYNYEKDVEEAIKNSVKNQMVSDVPIGVFLSGGIDSSLIAALAQAQSKKKINTFTIGFEESSFDERNFARKISSTIGTNHNEECFSYGNLETLIDNLGDVYDEPFSDSSQLPTLLLSQITRKKVTVALSGDGGDELYGGYYRYFLADKYKKLILSHPSFFRELMIKLIDFIPLNFWNFLGKFFPNKYGGRMFGDKLLKLKNILSDEKESSFHTRIVSNVGTLSDYLISKKEKKTILFDKTIDDLFPNIIERMQFVDMLTYLPDDILTKVDRASMYYSLEVRVPFLDNKVIEQAWSLPLEKKINDGKGKIILRNILKSYLPKKLFDRPKMGFGIPLDKILTNSLKPRVEYYLFSNYLKNQYIFNIEKYKQCWNEHKSGKRNWQFLIWNFLVFQIWYENWKK